MRAPLRGELPAPLLPLRRAALRPGSLRVLRPCGRPQPAPQDACPAAWLASPPPPSKDASGFAAPPLVSRGVAVVAVGYDIAPKGRRCPAAALTPLAGPVPS